MPVDSAAAHAELPVRLMTLFVETDRHHHVSLARHAELPDARCIDMPGRRIPFVGAVNRRHPRPVERVRTGCAGDAAQPTHVTAEVADALPDAGKLHRIEGKRGCGLAVLVCCYGDDVRLRETLKWPLQNIS